MPELVTESYTTGRDIEFVQSSLWLSETTKAATNRRVFRLFNLAFHNLDDELVVEIVMNRLETRDGFAIIELPGRN